LDGVVSSFPIGARTIGSGPPCFVIAEAGVNHNGDLALARRLVEEAAAAGADAVKFQTFTAERLVTRTAPKALYQHAGTEAGESQYDMLRRLELSEAAHRELMDLASSLGLEFLSTPFDEASADLLEQLGVLAYKVPSGELTNLQFLQHIACKGLPMIVSTGMASLGEVETALDAIEQAAEPAVALLHCVSNYPAAAQDCNLHAMATLRTAFGVPVGFSDHTLGAEVGLAAVALGATVLEKHLTLDKSLPGPDQAASATPGELAALIRGIRTVESALGTGRKLPTPSESDTRAVARKSLVAACDLAAGAVLDAAMLAAKRPGTGLPPAFARHLLGRKVRQATAAGTVLTLEMFE
jgi:N-acetylneuraminate synthase